MLPLWFGIVDAFLILWDMHNQRVILSMGMAWDTGAPLWPYQTPDTLLFALNFPAYLIGIPLGHLLHLYIVPWHYIPLFPAILFWWWSVGYALDRNLFSNQPLRWGWWSLVVVAVVVFSVLAGSVLRDAIAWWSQYCQTFFAIENIITLRLSTPGLWCAAFAACSVLIAKRRYPVIQR